MPKQRTENPDRTVRHGDEISQRFPVAKFMTVVWIRLPGQKRWTRLGDYASSEDAQIALDEQRAIYKQLDTFVGSEHENPNKKAKLW